MKKTNITGSVKARLPIYLHYLKSVAQDERKTISSAAVAEGLGLGEVQVRKDLALVSGAGKPKIGYRTTELIEHIEAALGVSDRITEVVVVGAGKLGKALLLYDGFAEFGLRLSAAFDKDEAKLGSIGEAKNIYPISEIGKYCTEHNVRIGAIAVPESEAQNAYETLLSCGVSAVWNFAPVRLISERGVKVRNENLAAALAVLAADIQ